MALDILTSVLLLGRAPLLGIALVVGHVGFVVDTLRGSVRDVYGGILDDVVLSAQGLGDLRVSKGHEGERAERLGDKDIDDLAYL